MLHSLQFLSSLTRDQTCAPAVDMGALTTDQAIAKRSSLFSHVVLKAYFGSNEIFWFLNGNQKESYMSSAGDIRRLFTIVTQTLQPTPVFNMLNSQKHKHMTRQNQLNPYIL